MVILFFFFWQTGAKKAYKKFKHFKGTTVDQRCGPITYRCGLCGASSKSFELLPVEPEQEMKKHDVKDSELSLPDKVKLAIKLVIYCSE